MEHLVHSTTRYAPYIHPSHDSILELRRTFPDACGALIEFQNETGLMNFVCIVFQLDDKKCCCLWKT